MYNQNYAQRPIPLVAVNPTSGKYEMTDDALKFLKSVPSPLGIVSVAGLYRTGKSYLLNRMLLNTNKPKQGFGVGPTINPCTKGLWCWGTPIKGKSQNGESINIIVIDTEGIGALDQDQTHDTRIFTLAILASSCFIYNSVGSIDQTAVQNLSLVVNLTKHIQLKSSNKSYDDEQDAEQMAHYFPTFYWVVRDFSLQLQDIQGNTITSKEYLQKALAPLKGSSQFDEDIEEKNKIRKLLTSFFKDRDCFTMVRPLVDQTKLQDLDSIPFEELRPDFIEQVISFRKRVTQGLKIKTVNGKQLNGDMYCSMLSSYVGAINEGAVPNIQNAWNYMCQEQCQKIQEQCELIFDKELKDNMKFPVQEEYFENTCQNAFQVCMMHFREKAIGDMSLSIKFQKELKERIKEKIKHSREQNIKASKEYLQKKVLQVFNPIMQQLKKQQFKTFEEFEKSINNTYENLVSNSPNLPFTKQKYLQLYKKVQRQGAEYIFKCLSKEMQNMKTIFKEKEDYYVKQFQTIKSDQQTDRKSSSNKISEMDREKIQAQSKIQKLSFELQKLKNDKESEIEKLSKNLSSNHSEHENNRKKLQTSLQQYQSKLDEVSRNFSKEQKVWEKDRTLMESKIKQQATSLQELEKERQIMTSKYQEINSETSLNHKESLNKAERIKGQLQNENKKLKEINFELTQNLKSVKEDLQERNDKFERTEKKLKEELNSKKREMQNFKNECQIEKKKKQQDLEDERDKITRTKTTLVDQLKRQRELTVQMTEDLRKTRADFETKQAELEQRIKFTQEQKRFLKDQLQESKRNHNRVIQDLKMQSTQVIEEREKIRIQEVRTQLTIQIKNVTISFQNERKKYIYQTENLRNANKQMQLQIKVVRQQLIDQRNNYKQFENQSLEKIQSLYQQLKNLERVKESTLMQKQSLLRKKIMDLESQIEYIKEKSQNQQRDTQQRNKECIIQLRVTYERQREDLENSYLREKDRAQKKYDEMVEEYEVKHRQQVQNLQEQMDVQKQEAAMIEDQLRSKVSELSYMVDSRDKEIENLKNQLAELKSTLSKREEEYTRKFEFLSITSKQEKQQMIFKLENLQQQNNQLEKDLMNINHQKQRLSNELEKTKTILKEAQEEFALKKEELVTSVQQKKRKLAEKQNELMEVKIHYEKQTALLTQQNQHILEKSNQLQYDLNRINEVNEEKIKKIKFDTEESLNMITQKFTTERNLFQEKYDKNKKAFKQAQSALNKKLNEMEKERAVDTEKISNLEMKLSSLQERRRLEYSSLEKEYERIKELYKTEKAQLSSEINKLKEETEEISRKKLDIETKYDKDTLLLRNQVQNQINIRETRQASFNQTIRQLQARIDNLQRSKSSEQSKAESTYNEQRVRIEETYRTKISESSKTIEKLTRDYDELSKRYEYEIKDLRELLAVERQTKQSLQVKLDKKMNEWQELQRKMNHDLDILKSEREQRGLEFQKQLEKQKQALKIKLNDAENKLRAAEKERSSQFMEYQRDKARYSQQQSGIAQQMEHLKDKITKLQKDKARLDKQNERLKVEKRNTKTASYIRFNTGLEERKSTIAIKKEKMEKMESNFKQEDDENKQNIISQQILLD